MQRRLQLLSGVISLVPGFAMAAATARPPAPLQLSAMDIIGANVFPLTTSLAALTFGGLALFSMLRSNARERAVKAIGGAIEKLEQGEEATLPSDTKGKMGRVAESFNAMAHTVVERERHIRHAAMHDAATDLPNRPNLEWRLADLVKKSTSGARVAAVSLDRLKSLRLSLGYESAEPLVADEAALLSADLLHRPIRQISD